MSDEICNENTKEENRILETMFDFLHYYSRKYIRNR